MKYLAGIMYIMCCCAIVPVLAQRKVGDGHAKPGTTASHKKPKGDQPGVSRWSVKTSLSAQSDPLKPTIVKLSDMLKLPAAPGVKKDDPRFQAARIPKAKGMKVADGDIVQTSGYLWLVAHEVDGDYHIQMSNSATSGDHCLIVEAPKPDPTFVKDAKVRDLTKIVRDAINARIFKGKPPAGDSVHVLKTPLKVTVAGQLFYDDAHVGEATARGKKGMHAVNLWELHPLTAIKFGP